MKNLTQFFCFLLFFLSCRLFLITGMVMAQNTTIPVNVGVVLDLDTGFGKMGLSCISMALLNFYHSHPHYKTRLLLQPRDSKKDVVAAAAAALDLIKNVEVQAIIGPQSSTQADFIIDLGSKAHVPIISFSATSTSLSSIRSPYFIRATHNDSSQVKAISAIIQAFGWREAVPIYVDSEYGEGFIPFLVDALQEIDTKVPYRSVVSPSATDDKIVQELGKLMTMETRVFIVHMPPSLGFRLFLKAKDIGMMSEGYVWIVTDGIGNLLSSMNSSVIDSMQGVLGVKTYVPKTEELKDFRIRWKRKLFQQENSTIDNVELNVYGLWANDAALALAMAAERVGWTKFGFQKANVSGNSTDLETFGVSHIGSKFLRALSTTTFKGLTGDFRLVKRELQSSVFQIVNVIDNGERGIGFWTQKNGIVSKFNLENTSIYSTSKSNLSFIRWPGKTQSVPKGWEMPINGKKLRIGVPVKEGFSEFVNVTDDPITITTNVTGYCIDVFKAAMKALPYAVDYDFIPFNKKDCNSPGYYNDLVHQVYLKNYDAVVGDTTIIANRSLYVDFTLPYTESGVSMIVPIKEKNKNAWIFLKPLTWELWVTSACFFVFIGFVIWVLEHRINEDFRGPPSHQVGTIFWFSFSTMVFVHKGKVVSNLARIAVIILFFVVLILTQSYTASLASMLTVQKLEPTFTDVNEVIKSGQYVGYLAGSFVLGLLKGMNVDESKLRVYNSREECNDGLSKGSAKGGFAAAFDEIPYLRFVLAHHCSKYIMVGRTYKTAGFGFVFPKGSPLVADVSKAILKVTESNKMVELEKFWFGEKITSCPDPSTSRSSDSLSLDSFWGLFVIAAVAISLALAIFTTMFLYEHRHVWMQFDPKASIRRKIRVMMEHFDKKDLNSYTFRKSVLRDSGVIDSMDCMGAVEASPNTNHPPSPSSLLNESNCNIVFFEEQGITPSTDYDDSSPNRQTLPRDTISAVELTCSNQEIEPYKS